jgi:hypothetical protein
MEPEGEIPCFQEPLIRQHAQPEKLVRKFAPYSFKIYFKYYSFIYA